MCFEQQQQWKCLCWSIWGYRKCPKKCGVVKATALKKHGTWHPGSSLGDCNKCHYQKLKLDVISYESKTFCPEDREVEGLICKICVWEKDENDVFDDLMTKVKDWEEAYLTWTSQFHNISHQPKKPNWINTDLLESQRQKWSPPNIDGWTLYSLLHFHTKGEDKPPDFNTWRKREKKRHTKALKEAKMQEKATFTEQASFNVQERSTIAKAKPLPHTKNSKPRKGSEFPPRKMPEPIDPLNLPQPDALRGATVSPPIDWRVRPPSQNSETGENADTITGTPAWEALPAIAIIPPTPAIPRSELRDVQQQPVKPLPQDESQSTPEREALSASASSPLSPVTQQPDPEGATSSSKRQGRPPRPSTQSSVSGSMKPRLIMPLLPPQGMPQGLNPGNVALPPVRSGSQPEASSKVPDSRVAKVSQLLEPDGDPTASRERGFIPHRTELEGLPALTMARALAPRHRVPPNALPRRPPAALVPQSEFDFECPPPMTMRRQRQEIQRDRPGLPDLPMSYQPALASTRPIGAGPLAASPQSKLTPEAFRTTSGHYTSGSVKFSSPPRIPPGPRPSALPGAFMGASGASRAIQSFRPGTPTPNDLNTAGHGLDHVRGSFNNWPGTPASACPDVHMTDAERPLQGSATGGGPETRATHRPEYSRREGHAMNNSSPADSTYGSAQDSSAEPTPTKAGKAPFSEIKDLRNRHFDQDTT